MDKVAIITPIVLQTEAMLNIYLANLATYNPVVDTKVFVICNKNVYDTDEILEKFKFANKNLVFDISDDGERSVAGAWNFGIAKAIKEKIDVFHILAADIALHPNCMKIMYDKLVNYSYELVSSVDFTSSYGNKKTDNKSCDFGSIVLTKDSIYKYGWFDREYRPAYFEDNDYMTRVNILNGKYCRCLSAIHYHYGSATIKVDSDVAHHVKYWFEINRKRFINKWGGDVDLSSDRYYHSPYDSGRDIGWWPEQNNAGYNLAGGIHE